MENLVSLQFRSAQRYTRPKCYSFVVTILVSHFSFFFKFA